MSRIRQPAVAGLFYPSDPEELRSQIDRYLDQVEDADSPPPKALIAPHAGYVYSGPVAATAYARLKRAADTIERVVLLGPSHRVGFFGLAASSAEFFRTPLGDVPVDQKAVQRLLQLPQVHEIDEAHLMEHSLEVHLPFLQETLGEFSLVPLVVGDAGADEVAEVLEALWGGPETLIVISSDLSHYHDYDTARGMDESISEAIEGLNPEGVGYEGACGRNPINGLLRVASRKGMRAQTIDLRNSGDTAGPRDRVVGYGAYVFH
jgi:AmmeMemoRadiSam system protein B